METLQIWHDNLCREFEAGNVPKEIFLLLDDAIEECKQFYELTGN